MKFKTSPSGNDFGNTGKVVVGLVLGAIASRAVVSVLHTPTAGADAATMKKEDNMLLAKRGGVVLVSGYAATGIQGNDTASMIAKAACQGMAVMQVLDGVTDLAAKTPTIKTPTTKTQKIVSAALGLGCPTDVPTGSWGMGRTKRRAALKSPVFSEYQEVNPLELAVQQGAEMAYSN